eukprot:TRINITY_DN3262_c0_g1_i2.p1 TRINITY_DN3262_c0_g1~~TRINITY_DN3262_c0_g1_i2.p1  ORF type:complete len:281 (+),score=82.25 TRINITY_DN3262_c0_g1_i2:99-941(+)
MGNKQEKSETASTKSLQSSSSSSSSSSDSDKSKSDSEHKKKDATNPEFKGDIKGVGADEIMKFMNNKNTTKPKGAKQEKLHNTLKATMKATLGGDLWKTVQLPENEDVNEWIAVNTVHFYNAATMIYNTCADFCNKQSCPIMSAGKQYEYFWKDDEKYKKPTSVSAPEYIELLLNWVSEQIGDATLFPVEEGAKFPSKFLTKVKDIYKRLFRIYAHIYYSHFEKFASIGANGHLNTCFKHFIFFVLQFQLIQDKDMLPLKTIIDRMKAESKSQQESSTKS